MSPNRIKRALVYGVASICLSSLAHARDNCKPGNSTNKPELKDDVFSVLWEKVPTNFDPLNEIVQQIPGVPQEAWKAMRQSDPIMLPNGEIVAVGDYLKNLNQIGTCLAHDFGQNLLGGVEIPAQFAEYYHSAQELVGMAKDVKTMIEDLENFDVKKHAEKVTEQMLKEQAARFLQDTQNPTLRALYDQATALKDLQDGFDPVPVPSIPVRQDLESKTFKDWNPKFGNPKYLEAVSYSSFDMRADNDEAQVLVNSNATVEIFKSGPKKILEASATAIAPANDKIAAEVIFWVAGNDFGGPIKYEVAALDEHDEYVLPIIDVYTEFWFSIGPIPMSVKLGANGDMGLKWRLWSSALTVNGSISPKIGASAYAECAVDIVIAAVGAGGRLTLIEADAGFVAYAGLNFDGSGSPYFVNGVDTTSNITLLSGDLFGFVEIPVPTPPFVQRMEKSFYKYPGVVKPTPGIAVNFAKVTKPEGVTIAGDADEEDFVATDLDN
ncbi:MAG: hypothetical protein M3Q07_02200, partial [Pseudobdellovibrionaceae bacterium]|nr:hypothetical protein [Pseudobdellovibrionaceae bacterium]